MGNANNELSVKVEQIKLLLVTIATGGRIDFESSQEYVDLRGEIVQHSLTKSRIPNCLRVCRSLSEWWPFIKAKFDNYADRRAYVREEFDSLLTHLETSSESPNDAVTSVVLESSPSEYVHAAWTKALERRTTDPDGAITAARSLLETVCKHVIEEMGETYDDKSDLPALYGRVAEKLNLAPSQHTEQIFKKILGSCSAVVQGLGEMRNKVGDAHGKGSRGVRAQPRHAELAVNLAGTMATFIISTAQSKASAKT